MPVACFQQGKDVIADVLRVQPSGAMIENPPALIDDEGLRDAHDAPASPGFAFWIPGREMIGVALFLEKDPGGSRMILEINAQHGHPPLFQLHQQRMFDLAGRAPGGEKIYNPDILPGQIRSPQDLI